MFQSWVESVCVKDVKVARPNRVHYCIQFCKLAVWRHGISFETRTRYPHMSSLVPRRPRHALSSGGGVDVWARDYHMRWSRAPRVRCSAARCKLVSRTAFPPRKRGKVKRGGGLWYIYTTCTGHMYYYVIRISSLIIFFKLNKYLMSTQGLGNWVKKKGLI